MKLNQEQILILAAQYLHDNFNKINADLEFLKKSATEQKANEALSIYIPLEKVLKTLSISRKQFYLLRKKNLINFYQVGRKIFVSKTDLDAFMSFHYFNNQNQ